MAATPKMIASVSQRFFIVFFFLRTPVMKVMDSYIKKREEKKGVPVRRDIGAVGIHLHRIRLCFITG